MKRFFYIFLLFLVLFSCKDKAGYVITGQLQHFADSVIYVSYKDSGMIDTIVCKNKQFIIKNKSDSLSHLSVYIPSLGTWLDVWAENKNKITVAGDVKYPDLITVDGNAINNKLSEFKTANHKLIQEKADLFYQQQENAADSLIGSSDETTYAAKISNINHQLKEIAEKFIKKNPKEPASLVLLRDYLIDRDNVDKIHEYLSLIQYPATQQPIYKQLESFYQKIKATSIGSPAPGFEIIDIYKDTAQLSDYKNNYLLLTFTASWCDVCRKDNKELVQIYNAFNHKGLQMFTVSFDEDKQDWLSRAKEDKITWRQAIDTHGWGAEMLDLYNITNIPANYLIDKNGIIVAKNLFGEKLKDVLNEKLPAKK